MQARKGTRGNQRVVLFRTAPFPPDATSTSLLGSRARHGAACNRIADGGRGRARRSPASDEQHEEKAGRRVEERRKVFQSLYADHECGRARGRRGSRGHTASLTTSISEMLNCFSARGARAARPWDGIQWCARCATPVVDWQTVQYLSQVLLMYERDLHFNTYLKANVPH